ncbi:MAG: hypothetical protein IT436_11855 [Phycisphaerales bacterium]|nr:hypothetical protein [Phycisphaerales bacterium]
MSRRAESVYGGFMALSAAGVGTALLVAGPAAPPEAQPLTGPRYSTTAAFTNWESPHVHPMEMTPDGSRLLVVNTAAAALDVYDLSGAAPALIASVPVGLDPVTVRARGSGEAWVVNHISDSITIVDLAALNVKTSFKTGDEPCDVVFAGMPQRAFVSCSMIDTIQVYNPDDLAAAPSAVVVQAQRPRSLAVSADGQTVYAAIFESGNRSTVLGGGALARGGTLGFPPDAVGDPSGPYGGVNPPPNTPAGFDPPLSAGATPALPVSLIVKQGADGAWRDDRGTDWSDMVSGANADKSGRLPGWTLLDHDIAAISTSSLAVSYADHLMNIGMSLAVQPGTGRITMVGTDATNEIRYEPVVNGTFLRVNLAVVDASLASSTVKDLNPHLTYTTPTVDQSERDKSVGDPRQLVWNSAGTRAYISGMGSSNIVVIDAAGDRDGPTIDVGEGPTGLALDEARGRLYVLNRFAGSISVVSTATHAVEAEVTFHDPTPAAIKTGRKHLYDTHKNSGLGHVACASCHVDGKMDRLAWDLGDPTGTQGSISDRNLGQGLFGLEPGSANPAFETFHPMKGPMTTQTLQDIIGKEPHHWRGDRLGIEAFNSAFIGLQGDDVNLTTVEMQEFEDFLATITFPPNPYRNFDNSLPTNLPLPGHYKTGRFGGAGTPLPNGNAQAGLTLYRSTTRRLNMGAFACVTCHTLPTGAGTDMRLATPLSGPYQPIAVGPLGQHHLALVSVDGTSNITTKIPQTRNMHKKSGFNTTILENTAGFGFLHDGSVDSIERFVSEPVFTVQSDQEVANLVALMLSFSGSEFPAATGTNPLEPPGVASSDSHAAVGAQTTLVSLATAPLAQITFINQMLAQANTGKVGLIVKGRPGGLARGWMYTGTSTYQSDRRAETISHASLLALAAPGSELTFTVVPKGGETRLGVDRDQDTWYDRDELSVCDDPMDPLNYPGGPGSADLNADLIIDFGDYLEFLNLFDAQDPRVDYNGDGFVDFGDYLEFLNLFDRTCG